MGELLTSPFVLSSLLEVGYDLFSHVVEELDIQSGVDEPVMGEGTSRPVRGGMFLEKGHPAVVLDHRSQADARKAEKASSQLGVEQVVRTKTVHRQAWHVLGGGMEDPLCPGEGIGKRLQTVRLAEGDGIDEVSARPLTAQLDEVGARVVTETMGPLGVDRDGTVAVLKRLARVAKSLGRSDDWRHSFPRLCKDGEIAHASLARRGEIAVISSGIGETPHESRQRSLHDSACESTSSAVEKVGVHEARTSM